MASRSMDNKKDDKYYAQKAIENISTIQRYISGKSYEEFLSDEELIDAVMFRLIQTIENTIHPNLPPTKDKQIGV